MRLKFLAVLLIALLVLPMPGYCANYNNWGNTDLNLLLGRQLPYDLIHLGQERGGVSTMVSDSLAIPLSYSVVKKEVGSNTPLTLANGVAGQILHLTISSYSESDPGDARLTPTTKTGFASLDFNAVGDSVTLLYVDNTSGWVLIGSNSVTINQ